MVIHAAGLTKRFGSVVALEDLHLEIDQGEVFGYLGPNGAGKTTTIRLLLDFLRPTRGTCSVLGGSGADTEIRRRIGHLPADFPVDPRYTTTDLLDFFGRLRGGHYDAWVKEILDRFDLDPHRPIGELSTGNKRKVGIVQAVAHRPELLILDEPSTGLDPLLQHEFQLLVRELVADGATVFLSSHVLHEVEELADRVGILRAGRLVTVATVEELRLQARQRITLRVTGGADPARFAGLPEVTSAEADGDLVRLVVEGSVDRVLKAAARFEVVRIVVDEDDLEDVFLRYYTGVGTVPHEREESYLDAILASGRVTPEQIPKLRRQLEAAEERLDSEAFTATGTALWTELPRLLDRIESHGDQARALLPIAAAPLVVLAWFVVYLAVSYAVSGQRHEVGVVALRGVKWRTRAVTVALERLLPLLVGVPAGMALAQLLVALAGPAAGEMVPFDRAQLVTAGLAAAGTIAAALLALRRELAAPVVALLRQIPPRRRRLAVASAEVLAVALGVVVVADLWVAGGELAGIRITAPVIVMLAVAVVAGLAVRPLIELAGRWSLRRGRLGTALSGLYLARRPGATRLLVVLALALGTLGFAATGIDVAAQGRANEAGRLLGAPRVLEVGSVDREELLQAVRAADPSGQSAMAVVTAPRAGTDPPVVAVDATRLDRVASWSTRYGALGPAEVATLLRPAAPDPVVIGDGELVANLSPNPFTPDGTLVVSLLLAADTGTAVTARFGPLVADQPTYRTTVVGCADGCRLAGLTVSINDSAVGRVGVTVGSLRQDGKDVVPPDRLVDPNWWRIPEEGVPLGQLWPETARDGLLLTHRSAESGVDYELLTLDAPYPLPVVSAGKLSSELLTSIDGQLIRVDPQAELGGLPGVGASGVLLDLEYAERLAARPGDARSPQVWLTEDAPAGIVDRLRDQGLVITGERTRGELQSQLEVSGAALALRFYRWMAVLAVLVGLGALVLVVTVDRHTWGRGLQLLRVQGLAKRTTTTTAVWSYGGIVAAGAVAGMLAAAAAWVAAGELLPLGVDRSLLADWPDPEPVMVPLALAVVSLFVAAVLAAWRQHRGVAER